MNELIEEIKSIVAERKFAAGMELIEMRHEIGKAILENPLYAKNKKGQGKLLAQIAAEVGLQDRSLRYCIEFAEKYPKLATALQTLQADKKLPAWRDIVRELPSGEHERKEERPKCRHCPEHCPITNN
jgi:hypothetical protein